MSLTVSVDLVKATKSPSLSSYREDAEDSRSDREILIESAKLGIEGLTDLAKAASRVKDDKTARAVESILAAREGKFDKPVPNFKAFLDVLTEFLKAELIDGWVYVTREDGKLYPELVTKVSFDSGSGYRGPANPRVQVVTKSYGLKTDRNHEIGVHERVHIFSPGMVVRRRIGDIMAA